MFSHKQLLSRQGEKNVALDRAQTCTSQGSPGKHPNHLDH